MLAKLTIHCTALKFAVFGLLSKQKQLYRWNTFPYFSWSSKCVLFYFILFFSWSGCESWAAVKVSKEFAISVMTQHHFVEVVFFSAVSAQVVLNTANIAQKGWKILVLNFKMAVWLNHYTNLVTFLQSEQVEISLVPAFFHCTTV